jgi:putative transposase
MQAVHEICGRASIASGCAALGVSRATYYRSRRPKAPRAQRPTPSRALSLVERDAVYEQLHAPRFVDLAPAQIFAQLLDEDRYLCSVRTMYRLLEQQHELRERRAQLRHPAYSAPQLLATRPNELWSWDITKLLGPAKWTYFYLYVILDVFSRFVVGWMVATRESATLAQRLIEQTCRREAIEPGTLTLHADRGSSMTSKPVALLLADLGVTKTHSRPHVSNDNPFSEAHFKTLKYRPEFPERFGSLEHARALGADLFRWYCFEHHHSALGWLTPADVHHGQAAQRIEQRRRVLEKAHAAHPERFVHGVPSPAIPPAEVWINPPRGDTAPAPSAGSPSGPGRKAALSGLNSAAAGAQDASPEGPQRSEGRAQRVDAPGAQATPMPCHQPDEVITTATALQ